MKQSLRLSSVLLLVLVLSLTLSACDDISLEEIWNSNANVTTDLEATREPEDQTQSISEDTEETSSQNADAQIIGLDEHLIAEITDYLTNIYAEYELPEDSFAIKMDKIQNEGAQPLFVKFDAQSLYYVCAYYNPTHALPENEKHEYCCIEDYTWVRFDSPEQISDGYNDLEFVCAFQINRAQIFRDIGPQGGATKNMEHYRQYQPDFVQGMNVAEKTEFDKSFIYLNYAPLETAYCTVDRGYHSLHAMHCIELDGQYYVPRYLYSAHADGTTGTIDTQDLEWDFGTYYDYAMSVMIMDRYSVTDQYGNMQHYGLISVDEIAKMIQQ